MKSGNRNRPPSQVALRDAVAVLPLILLPLAMDGFQEKVADNPERREMLTRLPANHFVERFDGNTVLYIYSDPTACHCIYVGTQQAYNNYKADRQSVVVYLNDDPTLDWNAWGPWPVGN
jgi:hypothetical protein